MHSALYVGRLRHLRFAPVSHDFGYRVALVWLDLAELPGVFRGRWLWSTEGPALAWFRRADYLGDPAVPLDQAVRDHVERESGSRPTGPVRLLTQLRTFGGSFNPVSFYYCYDAADRYLETIVAQIINTPWNERHAYVLSSRSSAGDGQQLRFRFRKSFHVSPFMPMELDCDWRFTSPGARLAVHMENETAGATLFAATLTLERCEINGRSLARVLIRYPFVALQVLGAIYWQALRLWLKGLPTYGHPAKRADP